MTNLRTERTEEVRHVEFRMSEGSDGNTLEGYAAVFNDWTDIRDHMGTYRERIRPGAFKRSIGMRTPVLQFDHGQHPLLGSLPLGTITTLREDKNGLFVRARLSDNWLVEPFRDAIRDRAVTGMSFRFRAVQDQWGHDAEGRETREVIEADVPELGPVVFPAYVNTAVAVRSLMGSIDDQTLNELVDEMTRSHRVLELIANNSDPELVARFSTSGAAPEPAEDDERSDEPPLASRDNHQTIADLLRNAGLSFLTKESTDVSQ